MHFSFPHATMHLTEHPLFQTGAVHSVGAQRFIPSKEKEAESTMQNEEYSYNMLVKKRLIDWQDKFKKENKATLNYTAIAEAMETHFNIQTSTQKVAAMFNSQSNREIKLQELVALATLFNIPLWDICEYPNNPNSGINTASLIKGNKTNNGPIRELNNPYYFTSEGQYYYCYYFRPKHFQNRIRPIDDTPIEEARMSISLKDGHTIVKLEEMKSNTTFFGDPMPSFVLTGKLYHFENTDMAYSFINDDTGRRAMALMFTFLNLSADIRYYMTVGMMTFSLNQTHEPLFQKMAVFRVRQNYQEDQTAEVLRGILSLNSSPLIIDEKTLEKLKEDEGMRKFLSEGQSPDRYYLFNEAILRDSFLISDDHERMLMLLQLRKNSLYPAHEVVSEPDTFTDFIKQYQLDQLEKHLPEG